MKKGCGCLVAFSPLILIFFFLIVLSGGSSSTTGGVLSSSGSYMLNEDMPVSDEVKQYQSVIEEYAKEYGVSEYVAVIMALMQVESGGKGGDPMQSSESKGLPPNTITDPRESIKQGVLHFSNVVKKAESVGSDVWSAIQSYNYGGAFLDFVRGNWTFEQAKQFSSQMANGRQVMYVNKISTEKGYNYRYDYGNMFYVYLVQQYVIQGTTDSVPIDFNGVLAMPIDNPIITSHFGIGRSITLQNGSGHVDVHNGTDFVNGDPNAPIKASASGTVVHAGLWVYDGALAVIIKHSENLYTHYWHLSSVSVQVGQSVMVGQKVGVIGTTGLSTGIHLHFGVSTNFFGAFVNPMDYLQK